MTRPQKILRKERRRCWFWFRKGQTTTDSEVDAKKLKEMRMAGDENDHVIIRNIRGRHMPILIT